MMKRQESPCPRQNVSERIPAGTCILVCVILTSQKVKRRTKQRGAAARKAEKEAKAPPSTAPKRKQNAAEEDETKLDPRQYFEIRTRAVKKLKQSNDPNPYPHKFHVTTDMPKFVEDYKSLETGEEKKDIEVRVGARIYGKVSRARRLPIMSLLMSPAIVWREPLVLRSTGARCQDPSHVPIQQCHR